MNTTFIVIAKPVFSVTSTGQVIALPEQQVFSSPHESICEGFIDYIKTFSARRGIPFNRDAFTIVREFSQ